MKRIFSAFLALSIMISTLLVTGINAYAQDFDYDASTKTLTIHSDTAMVDFTSSDFITRPWDSYTVENLVINEPVSKIGSYSFAGLLDLTSVSIPSTVTTIGECAFFGCDNLKSITLPDSVTSIGGYAFGYDVEAEMIEDFVAVCDVCSYAQSYCLKNYIPFETKMQNNTATAHITGPAELAIWSYVAPADGVLTFRCLSEKYTIGAIFDQKSYAYNSTYATFVKTAIAKDDGSSSTDVKLFVSAPVQKGARYYLVSRFSNKYQYDGSSIFSNENGIYNVGTSFVCTTHDFQSVFRTDATCIEAGEDELECSVCNAIDTAVLPINPNAHSFVDGVCELCGVDQFDFSAHNSALAEYESILNNNEMFTTASFEEYKTAVESAKAQAYLTQDELDIITKAVLDAKALLKLKSFDVTVTKVVDEIVVAVQNEKVEYGEIFNTLVELEDTQQIYKWTQEIDDKTAVMPTRSTDVSIVVRANINLVCYINTAPSSNSTSSMVTYVDKSNKVVDIRYIDLGEAVDTNVTAPSVVFYTFNGWEVVSGDAENAGKEGVVLRATYVYSRVEANSVKIIGKDGVFVNGKAEYNAYYDEKLVLTGADSYSYADEQGNVISGIIGDYIFAPNNQTTLYIVGTQCAKASTKITGYIDENNALTINAQYFLPQGFTAVKAGIVVSSTDTTPTLGEAGCKEVVSATQGAGGEYSITLGYSAGKQGVLQAASYLICKDAQGELHTVYSDTEAIAFGN